MPPRIRSRRRLVAYFKMSQYHTHTPQFASFTGVEFDSTLGYPGEGPGRRPHRCTKGHGKGGHFVSTTPPVPPPVTPSETRKKPRFRYTVAWLLATLMPGTLAAGVEHLDEAGCEKVVQQLCQHTRRARFWRGKFEGNTTTDAAEVQGRPRADSPSMQHNAQYQRVRRVCRDMYCALADRPEADQALAINELIETYVTRSVRL